MAAVLGGWVFDLHGGHVLLAHGGFKRLGVVEVALREEVAAEVDLHDSAFCGEGFDHVVGHVAGVAGDGAAAGVRGDDGRGAGLERVVEGCVGGVGDVDHHAEAVHLADDVFAEGSEAVVMLDLGVVDVALRVGPVVGVEVGEGHVADAEGVVVAEEAEGVFDGVAAFDAHEGGDLVFVVGADDVVGGGGEDEVVGVRGDDVGADGVDHLQGAVGGVIVLDVLGTDVDGEELGAEEAFHAREIGLAGFVGGGDVVAVDGAGGDVVVGVDEDGVAGDAVDLFLRNFVGLLGDEGKSERRRWRRVRRCDEGWANQRPFCVEGAGLTNRIKVSERENPGTSCPGSVVFCRLTQES